MEDNNKQLRDSISDLLSNNDLPQDITTTNNTSLPEKQKGQFNKMLERTKNKAVKCIDSLLKF